MIMVTERQVQEMVTRCVSCMVFYVNSGETRDVRGAMAAELRDVAFLVTEWGLGGPALRDCLLAPIEAELVARYGPVAGRKLVREFAGAFVVPTGPDPAVTRATA